MKTHIIKLALAFSSFVLGSMLSAQVPQLINYQGRIAVSDVNFEGEGQFKFALVGGGSDLTSSALASATVFNGFVVGATITDGGSGYTATPTVTINGTGAGAVAIAVLDAGVVTGITISDAGSGYGAEGTTIVISEPSSNISYDTYWSSDGSSTDASEPTSSVALTVTKGLYSVLLGDTTLANMTAIPISVFANSDVRLRVWFNDGSNGSQLLTPDQRIASVGYAMMAGDVPDGSITSSKIAAGAITANEIADGAITTDKLAGGSLTEGFAAEGAVIMTSEARSDLIDDGFIQLGILPASNPWTATSLTNAPDAREGHTAVWTGSEMIIWGGSIDDPMDSFGAPTDTGGRYDPSTDTWTATSLTNAPDAREGHAAVWTGSEMIIWGGEGPGYMSMNSGGRYDPSTDTWTVASTTNAPGAREDHTAVWTGSEMIIWGGGEEAPGGPTDGRYDPSTDTWTATSLTNAPDAREDHTAVWTGSEMIIWGGSDSVNYAPTNTGGRYDPSTDTWTATSLTNAPDDREDHTAVWTGSEMIIWGGSIDDPMDSYGAPTSSGNRYDPSTDTWTATSLTNAPDAREDHTAVWTGSEMIIWGGFEGDYMVGDSTNTGGRYDPSTDTWTATSWTDAPHVRDDHTAVWTGSEMIIWGGSNDNSDMPGDPMSTGGIYRVGKPLYIYAKP